MEIESWALTDVGRARKHNEDGWLIDPGLGLFAVADGMGGHAAGEIASAQALRVVQSELEKKKSLFQQLKNEKTADARARILREIELAINAAAASIYELAQSDKKRHGMGTTLSMLLVVGRTAFMAHVGDSRIYLLRARAVHQLSEDHSYLWEQFKKGNITLEEARRSPFANVITRAVGITETVQVDTLVFEVLPGDMYLLCSDGLHGYLDSDLELQELLGSEEGEYLPRKLITLANARGGKDNITALVLRLPGDQSDPMAVETIGKLDVLRKIPLFRHLSYKELVKVYNHTSMRTARPGDWIIEEGKDGDEVFIILLGEVEVIKGGRTLTVLTEGVHFGEMALVDNSPRSASVRARKLTRMMILNRASFYQLVRTEPVLSSKLLWSFVQVLSIRLRATNEALSGVAVDLGPTEGAPFADEGEVNRAVARKDAESSESSATDRSDKGNQVAP